MAFCRFCGKKLADGELCTCPQAQTDTQGHQNPGEDTVTQCFSCAENTDEKMEKNLDSAEIHQNVVEETDHSDENIQEDPGQQNQCAEQTFANTAFDQNVQREDSAPKVDFKKVKGHASMLAKEFMTQLKDPVKNTETYIRNGNVIGTVIFLSLQAIFSAFYALTVVGALNRGMRSLGDFGFLVGTALSIGHFNGFKAFILTILYSLIFSLLSACVYLCTAKIMGSDLNFKQSLAAASVRSMYLIPLSLISMILFLLNAGVGMFCFYVLGMIVNLGCFLISCRAISTEQSSKMFYVAMTSFILFTALTFLIGLNLFFRTYL